MTAKKPMKTHTVPTNIVVAVVLFANSAISALSAAMLPPFEIVPFFWRLKKPVMEERESHER